MPGPFSTYAVTHALRPHQFTHRSRAGRVIKNANRCSAPHEGEKRRHTQCANTEISGIECCTREYEAVLSVVSESGVQFEILDRAVRRTPELRGDSCMARTCGQDDSAIPADRRPVGPECPQAPCTSSRQAKTATESNGIKGAIGRSWDRRSSTHRSADGTASAPVCGEAGIIVFRPAGHHRTRIMARPPYARAGRPAQPSPSEGVTSSRYDGSQRRSPCRRTQLVGGRMPSGHQELGAATVEAATTWLGSLDLSPPGSPRTSP